MFCVIRSLLFFAFCEFLCCIVCFVLLCCLSSNVSAVLFVSLFVSLFAWPGLRQAGVRVVHELREPQVPGDGPQPVRRPVLLVERGAARCPHRGGRVQGAAQSAVHQGCALAGLHNYCTVAGSNSMCWVWWSTPTYLDV